jgi:hypothetical protein
MPQVDDLSRSLVAFDQDATLIVVVEMSEASWRVAGMAPGVDRQPLKKLGPDPDALLRPFGARDHLAGQLPAPNCSHDKSALSGHP